MSDAAHHFKKQTRQHVRRTSSRYNQDQIRSLMPGDNEDANGGVAGEDSPLLEREQTNQPQRRKIWGEDDPTPFSKYPKQFLHLTWLVLESNYVNVLLVFVPLGIISNFVGWSPSVVFILNFLAIVPLAALLSFATEELSARLGQTLGGLMNATFGNAVELIVSVHGAMGFAKVGTLTSTRFPLWL
ncbi:MAG: hypothetical protein INR71_01310 [Terriglobus roseus]|nr:hypothetical protein [Terriglobus roseus]